MVVELISHRDFHRARELVTGGGLLFEENFANLVGIFEEDALVAVGAREGNILKMIAIEPSRQSGALLGELVSELIRLGYEAGNDSFFIFTGPQNAASFQALNFIPLVHHPKTTLLEYGGGLGRYLEAHRSLVREGENGAVVVNCNPFTLGHRYLIEEAARRVDTLYVFVVREDRSSFPFEIRFRLVREGTADLANVTVLESSAYAVSHITFPTYFLKDADSPFDIQMEVDLSLFGRHLAPFFHIRRRFTGTEPYCRTTRLYSEAMKRILPRYGVETVQLERRWEGEEVVSAFRVREALRKEAYETVRRLVPPSTLRFILSDEGKEIRERLSGSDRRRH
jgi:[citrate (pro-3S)-lyase] ligase